MTDKKEHKDAKTAPETKRPSELSVAINSSKFWLAVIIIGLYLVLVMYLFNIAKDTDEKDWLKYLYLFAGVEAIVFAAVGYVFGKDVSRKTQAIADDAIKDAKKDKEKVEKEKRDIEKEKKKALNNSRLLSAKLISLREAVISENNQSRLKYSQFNQIIEQFDNKESFDRNLFKEAEQSRALELAKRYDNIELLSLAVDFDYSITAEDFQHIEIDGDRRYQKTGRFKFVPAYGKQIRVEIYRTNSKPWEFKASSIIDQEGIAMEMVISPLKSTLNSDYFDIKYK